MRTGVFVGSFNPFTIGHDSIVRRALPLFDRLVIGVVGDNVNKPDMCPAAKFIVKGVRSVADFEHEQWQADFNRRLGGIETILLYTEPELASVSSSALRELSHFGVDITPYLPKKP